MRFLRITEVKQRVPYSNSTIYRLIAAGKFPRPIPLGGKAVGFLESDIEAWIQARVDAAAQNKSSNAAAAPQAQAV